VKLTGDTTLTAAPIRTPAEDPVVSFTSKTVDPAITVVSKTISPPAI